MRVSMVGMFALHKLILMLIGVAIFMTVYIIQRIRNR
jgi:hypothetical protein